MEENKELSGNKPAKKGILGRFGFIKDVFAGFGMGVAFIIPGFSGGSVAAILGIYERLVGAIADIFKTFKKSVLTLLPIFIGLVLGAISLVFPIEAALGAFPIPTVCVFVGLAIGGLPTITDKLRGKITLSNIAAFAIPAAITVALCFVPSSGPVNLTNLNFGGYVLLFLIGVLGSAALVVPGISGSMILLILGYYEPLLGMIKNVFTGEDILTSVLVLAAAGIGIVVGFIAISVVMKVLLKKYPRGTYFAIVGFIIGSLPTIFVTTLKDHYLSQSISVPTNPWYWIVSVLLLLIGFAAAFLFVMQVKRMERKNKEIASLE